MKTREEAVAFIRNQLANPKEGWPAKPRAKRGLTPGSAVEIGPGIIHQHHYGVIDLRQLMDFIYEGEPATEAEKIPAP